MTKRKIFVVGYGSEYANWMEGALVNKIEDADLVLFTGGEDVDPSLYGEPEHPYTSSSLQRDMRETAVFEQALKLNKKMIGICRGAQFLCVMSGGRLVQHQQNPEYTHPIFTYDNKEIVVTSTHHQAQYPWNLPKDNFKLLGWSVGISRMHQDGSQKELPMTQKFEVENVYYPKINALGIQGHPEGMFRSNHEEAVKSIAWHREQLDLLMEGKL